MEKRRRHPMNSNGSASDQIAKRIREAVLTLRHGNERMITPLDTQQETVLNAIRTLARSRVSSILRQLRAANGFSYDEVASQTDLSKQILFDVEYKERRLTLDELRRLADSYGVGVNDILGIDID